MANCPIRPASVVGFYAKPILQKPGESFREFLIHHNTLVTVSETSDLACSSTDLGENWTESHRPSDTLMSFCVYGAARFLFADYYAGVIQYTMNGIDWEEQTKTPVSSSGLYNLDMYYAFSRYFLTGIAGNSAQNIFVLSGDLTGNFGGPWTSNNVYTRDHVVDSGYVFTFTCNNHNAIHVAVRRTFNTYVASNTINPFVNFSADYTFFAGESKPMRDFFVYEYGGTNILHRMAGNLVSNTLTISEVSSCPVTDSLASWGKFVEGFGRYKDRILLTLSTDGSRGAFSTDLGASFKPFTLSEDLQTSYMMNPHTRLWSYFTKGYRLRYHPASGKWFLGTGTSGIFELIPYYAGEENG